jgi:hypothetical protein
MANKEIPFNDFCEMSEVDPKEVRATFSLLIQSIDEDEMWDAFPMGGIVRDICISLLDVMDNNGPFTEEKVFFIEGITTRYIGLKLVEEDLGSQIVGIPDDLPLEEVIFVKMAIRLTEIFKAHKEEICEKEQGPTDSPAVVVYMTARITGEDDVEADFEIMPFDVDIEKEDISSVLYGILVEGLAKKGEPVAIGVFNDVFALAASDSGSVLPTALSYEEDFYSNPSSKVFNALNGMLLSKDNQLVTTSMPYIYDDFGKPSFTGKTVDMENVEEISSDPTDKGKICKTIVDFFNNISTDAEGIWKKSN